MADDFEKRLFQELCWAYDPDELPIMVRLYLNQRIELISKGGRLDLMVFDLIQWAASQPKMAGLPTHAAQFKIDKNSRVPVLEALRDEYEAAGQAVDPVVGPAAPTALPDELTHLLHTYESIPRLIEDGPARLALMEQTAAKMRAVGLEPLKLPDRLHLSPSSGERLAAVLALEETPDPRYLRWLAERMGCEPPFVGQSAAVALTNAAYVLDRGGLVGVRATAQTGLDLLPVNPDGAKRRTQLQRAMHVADRRTGTISRSPDILFDEVVTALAEAFQMTDLQFLLKAKLEIAMEMLVRMTNRPECVVFDLLTTADNAGWDADLIREAAAARPKADKLKDVWAKYARVI